MTVARRFMQPTSSRDHGVREEIRFGAWSIGRSGARRRHGSPGMIGIRRTPP
jgi:hypothetical protein